MAGNDEFTKLLLHCNGTDGSTSFPDDSSENHTVTAISNAQVDTAQSKFGGASALFDNNGDYLDVPDSADWDLGSGDFTIDCWVRFNNVSTNTICARVSSGTSYMYFTFESGTSLRFRDYTGVNNIDFTRTVSVSANQWYHVAVTRSGNDFRIFLDGVQQGATHTSSNAMTDRTANLNIGHLTVNSAYAMDGWIDEFRWSKGVARWTSNFTPPTEEYSSDSVFIVSESITFSETNQLSPSTELFTINEDINFSETNGLVVPLGADLITGNRHYNPLILVSDSDPAKIIKVDITDPESPTYSTAELVGATNAKDVSIDTNLNFAYVACADGIVVKVNLSNLNDQTIINLSDTDELLRIESNINHGVTYVSTDNEVGEIYLIDERSTFKIDSDFHVLAPIEFKIDSSFYITSNFKMDSDLQVLSENTFNIDTDFKCLTAQVDNVDPINLQDFHVFIDSVELEDTDLVLDSIVVQKVKDQQSQASFVLSRKHDQLNTTLSGNTVTITNQNSVEIKVNDVTIFNGKVSRIKGVYETTEQVEVQCLSEEATVKTNNITMSLPGLNSRLSLYNILMETPDINNPFIDPNNETIPIKYRGIRVNLGQKITQNVLRITDFDSTGAIADAIQAGTFVPIQNWTYFWGPTARKILGAELGQTESIQFEYIGTSLSPVGNDLWDLEIARHRRQRILEDTVTELGTYEVGQAPFNEISLPRSGKLITKFRWVDEGDGFYAVKDASYDFEEFAKRVADTEYQALLNINENEVETTCSFTMTVDAFLFYDINLLTRINVDNTTEANIYNNNNGFPVSVKSITINSSDRKVRVDADNIVTEEELELSFPDEESEEFNQPEQKILIAIKTDMATLNTVQ